MSIDFDAKTLQGLVWMQDNFIRNKWNEEGCHYFQIFLCIVQAIDGKCSHKDLVKLIEWTDPRSELYVGMLPPPDIDNSGGWGAARKMNEIHDSLKRLL